ncbi:MAG: MFS transporter [Cyanobacteria bacterium REEB67]|nr:MFS transporter [Cyanobacteria bacterium REEB67]
MPHQVLPVTPSTNAQKIWNVVQVSSGNFLEMYDFFVFAYYASAIGKTFFPSDSEFATLMMSFMTFGVGFLMRPLGAVVLGSYIDQHGRRAGLMLTLALMSIGTISIAFTPGYASIGIIAPIIVVCGRLLQGFSAGAELGGVSVYLSEMATPKTKGFVVSWQSGSQQIAVVFVALVGVLLSKYFSPPQLDSWAWRIPFVIGCVIIPLIFAIRKSLTETEEFSARQNHPKAGEILRTLASNWRIVITAMLLVVMSTVSFYFITAYTPTFGKEVLKLDAIASLIVTVCVGATNLLWVVAAGALSDRIGRTPILITATTLGIFTFYPALAWLTGSPSFTSLLAVELWFSLIYGVYNGAAIVYLTEIMPVKVRTVGFSVAYSLAAAFFGGFTPAVSTFLIHESGNRAMPAVWLTFAAVCGLTGTLISMRTAKAAN